MKLDNVRVVHALKHLQLVVYHLLVSLDILLQDNLDGDLALGAISFPHDTIGSGTQRLSEAVSRPGGRCLACEVCSKVRAGYELAVIAVGLAVQLVQHVGHCSRTLAISRRDYYKVQGEGARLITADLARSALLRCV